MRFNKDESVSMPSRAYTSFLQNFPEIICLKLTECQCPLGLIPHFYENDLYNAVQSGTMCQCPLGLIPHFYENDLYNAVQSGTMCQCPLGLIPHFYFVERRMTMGMYT